MEDRSTVAVTALFGMTLAELEAVARSMAQPRYRAKQIFEALYRQRVVSVDEMTTLPVELRERMKAGGFVVGLPEMVQTARSVDGTERYLMRMVDGETVETVWMPEGDGGERGDGSEAAEEVEDAEPTHRDKAAMNGAPGEGGDGSEAAEEVEDAEPTHRDKVAMNGAPGERGDGSEAAEEVEDAEPTHRDKAAMNGAPGEGGDGSEAAEEVEDAEPTHRDKAAMNGAPGERGDGSEAAEEVEDAEPTHRDKAAMNGAPGERGDGSEAAEEVEDAEPTHRDKAAMNGAPGEGVAIEIRDEFQVSEARPGAPAPEPGFGERRKRWQDVGTLEKNGYRRATICISSQVGCAVNCQFCLTAKLGIRRNLTAGEIAGQVAAVASRQGITIGKDRINLVFMGMGEPFLNYDAFMGAVRLLSGAMGLPESRMTVSTSGIEPAIRRFALEPVRPKLALSLNASNDVVREEIMPITRKWNIAALLDAVATIPMTKREYVTFEYVLLGGVNDQPEHAREVLALLRGVRSKVNLIVWNPGPGIAYHQPKPEDVAVFQKMLIDGGMPAYIRRPRGRDIYAACGQLKRTVAEQPLVEIRTLVGDRIFS